MTRNNDGKHYIKWIAEVDSQIARLNIETSLDNVEEITRLRLERLGFVKQYIYCKTNWYPSTEYIKEMNNMVEDTGVRVYYYDRIKELLDEMRT